MATKIKSMTEGKPMVLFLTFAIPLMAGNIFQQLYTVLDTMVVGNWLGVDALAALGAVDWLYWMMLGIIQGITQGFSIKMAQDFGAKKYDSLRRNIGNAVVLTVILSVILLGFGYVIAKPVLELLQTPDKIMSDSMLYVRVMFMGIPIVMAYNLLAGILRSLGDSKTPLYAMIIAAITNIALDIVFVVGFGWGIAGAAVATLIAQFISSVYCFLRLRKIEIVHITKEDMILKASRVGRLLILGLPMAFQNAVIAVGGMILQFVVNGYGVIFIAGYTASNKLYGILEVAATSYGYSIQTYVGQNIGAGKIKRIRKGVKAALLVSFVTSVVIALIMIISGNSILGMFITGTKEEIQEGIKVAYTYLTIMSVCLPVLYVLHIIRSTIQGLGNTLLPMLSGVAELVVRTSMAFLLPSIIGQNGIFYAEVLAWLGADIILVISYIVIMNLIQKKYENS